MSCFKCFMCFKKTYEAPEVVKIDYNHRSLMEVPPDIFLSERTLESLLLASNQIQDLPPNLFHCHELRTLDLSDNEISVIPAAIGSLTRLTTLDLSRNAITEVSDAIKNCKNLVILDISLNQLVKVPEGVSQLVNLEQLLLNDDCLEFLHANVGRLTKLRVLELRENQLQTLPKSLSRLSHLTRIDLSANDLPEIPEVVGSLTSLTELWLEGNSVRRIPKIIGNLTKLTCLDVANNDVREIADEISKCTQLVDLTLCINSLDSLPDSFPKLENLSVLRLDSNQIEYLPEDFGLLKNLTEFSLLHNLLKALPPSIGLLRKLHTLYLDDNLIAALPKELGSCASLTVLHAAKNRLTEIPSEFGHLSKLKVLALAGNLISHLPVSLLNISSLGAIWLSESQCKPMLQFTTEIDPATGQNVLTCYLLPQMPAAPIPTTTTEEEEPVARVARPSSRTIKFANDPESTVMEGNLKKGLLRAPTPYPKELRAMAKHATHYRQSRENGDVISPDEPEYEGDYAEDGVNADESLLGEDGGLEHGLTRRIGGYLDISALDREPQPSTSDKLGIHLHNGDDQGNDNRKPGEASYRYRHPFHANYHEDLLEQNKALVETDNIWLLSTNQSYSNSSKLDSEVKAAEAAAGDDVDKILERLDETNRRSNEVQSLLDSRKSSDVSYSLNGESPDQKVPPPYHIAARRAAFFRTQTPERPPSASSPKPSETFASRTSISESKYPHLPGLTTQFSTVAQTSPSILTTAGGNAGVPATTAFTSIASVFSQGTSSSATDYKPESPLYRNAPSTSAQVPGQSTGLGLTEGKDGSGREEEITTSDSVKGVTSCSTKTEDALNVPRSVDIQGQKSAEITSPGVVRVEEGEPPAASSVPVSLLSSDEAPLKSTSSTVSGFGSDLLSSTRLDDPENETSADVSRTLVGLEDEALPSQNSSTLLGSTKYYSAVSNIEDEKPSTKHATDGVDNSSVSSSSLVGRFPNAQRPVHSSSSVNTSQSRIPNAPAAYSSVSGFKSVQAPTSYSSSALPVSTTASSIGSRIPSLSSSPPKPVKSVCVSRIPTSVVTPENTKADPAHEPVVTSKVDLLNTHSNQASKSVSTSKIPSVSSPANNSFKRTGSGGRVPVRKLSQDENEAENMKPPSPRSQSRIPKFGSGGRKPWIFGTHKNLRVVTLDYKKINELGFTVCNGPPTDSTTDKSGVYVDSVELPNESVIKIGDKLLQVDGIDITNMTLDIVRKVLGNCQENIQIMVSRQS